MLKTMSAKYTLDNEFFKNLLRFIAVLMIIFSSIAFKYFDVDTYHAKGPWMFLKGALFGGICSLGLVLLSMNFRKKFKAVLAILLLPTLFAYPVVFILPGLTFSNSLFLSIAPLVAISFFIFVCFLYFQLFRSQCD